MRARPLAQPHGKLMVARELGLWPGPGATTALSRDRRYLAAPPAAPDGGAAGGGDAAGRVKEEDEEDDEDDYYSPRRERGGAAAARYVEDERGKAERVGQSASALRR